MATDLSAFVDAIQNTLILFQYHQTVNSWRDIGDTKGPLNDFVNRYVNRLHPRLCEEAADDGAEGRKQARRQIALLRARLVKVVGGSLERIHIMRQVYDSVRHCIFELGSISVCSQFGACVFLDPFWRCSWEEEERKRTPQFLHLLGHAVLYYPCENDAQKDGRRILTTILQKLDQAELAKAVDQFMTEYPPRNIPVE